MGAEKPGLQLGSLEKQTLLAGHLTTWHNIKYDQIIHSSTSWSQGHVLSKKCSVYFNFRPSIDPSDPLLPSTPAVSLAALVRAFYRARGPSSQLTPRDSPWCQKMYSVNLRQALLYKWPPVDINIRLANNLKLQKLFFLGCASKTHKVLDFNDYL